MSTITAPPPEGAHAGTPSGVNKSQAIREAMKDFPEGGLTTNWQEIAQRTCQMNAERNWRPGLDITANMVNQVKAGLRDKKHKKRAARQQRASQTGALSGHPPTGSQDRVATITSPARGTQQAIYAEDVLFHALTFARRVGGWEQALAVLQQAKTHYRPLFQG